MQFIEQKNKINKSLNFISFELYKLLVEIFKNGISKNDMTIFNKQLENVPISTVTLIGIYDSSHENEIIISQKNQEK